MGNPSGLRFPLRGLARCRTLSAALRSRFRLTELARLRGRFRLALRHALLCLGRQSIRRRSLVPTAAAAASSSASGLRDATHRLPLALTRCAALFAAALTLRARRRTFLRLRTALGGLLCCRRRARAPHGRTCLAPSDSACLCLFRAPLYFRRLCAFCRTAALCDSRASCRRATLRNSKLRLVRGSGRKHQGHILRRLRFIALGQPYLCRIAKAQPALQFQAVAGTAERFRLKTGRIAVLHFDAVTGNSGLAEFFETCQFGALHGLLLRKLRAKCRILRGQIQIGRKLSVLSLLDAAEEKTGERLFEFRQARIILIAHAADCKGRLPAL